MKKFQILFSNFLLDFYFKLYFIIMNNINTGLTFKSVKDKVKLHDVVF